MGQLSLAMARPFISAVEETLGTMTLVKVRHVAVKAIAEVGVESDVSVVAGLAGQTRGCCVLRMPTVMALRVVKGLLVSEEGDEITQQQMHDGVCDLMQLILDHAQRVHGDSVHDFSVSLPLVIEGRKYGYSVASGGDTAVMEFETEDGLAMSFVLCVANR